MPRSPAHRIRAVDLRAVMRRARGVSRDLREVCGLLVDNGYFLQMVEVRNKLKRPCGFWLHIGDCRRVDAAARRLGSRVVGTFHSHVASPAIPGATDIGGAEDDDLMLILDPVIKDAKLWRVRGGRAKRVPFGILA